MPSQRLLPATAIREWRHRHNLSQAAAAKACGVHRVTWSQWERDRVAAPHWLAWALSTIDLAETRKTKSVTTSSTEAEHFRSLVSAWRDETDGMSNPVQITDSVHYQAIIDMGWYITPYILRDMEEGGGHWYKALHTITGEWPVPSKDEGYPARMRAAWLGWGRANGYL